MLYQQYPILTTTAPTVATTTTTSTTSSGPTINNSSRKNSTSLPSFNELLTSIPLPNDFKNSNTTTTTATSPITSTNNNYYVNQPPIQHRLPTPPLYTTTSTNSNSKSQQVSPHLQPVQNYQQPSVPQVPQHYYPSYHYGPPQQSQQQQPPPPHQIHQIHQVPTSIPQMHPYYQPTTTITNNTQEIRSSSTGNLASAFTSSITTSTSTSPIQTNTTNKDPRRKHVCKVCSRSFTTSGHLARHNRIHTGERKHECPWPTCDARFARQDNCNQHYKTHTNGKNKRNRLAANNNGHKGKSLI
ncbi:NRG1 Transcriptional regulator NRG1 [Candida maltosa Xu316]